jgi:hypothetical protein
VAGPRFTYIAWTGHAAATDQRRLQIFGQGLFGGVHGFDGLYPATSGVTSSAGSLAIEAGGGVNLFLTKTLGVRLLEAEYVRTELPNNASNTQNDMRLSFGFAYHLGARRRRDVDCDVTALAFRSPLHPLGAACSGLEAGVNALQAGCERRQHPALTEPPRRGKPAPWPIQGQSPGPVRSVLVVRPQGCAAGH